MGQPETDGKGLEPSRSKAPCALGCLPDQVGQAHFKGCGERAAYKVPTSEQAPARWEKMSLGLFDERGGSAGPGTGLSCPWYGQLDSTLPATSEGKA